MKTTFDITRKSIKNYIAIVEIKIDEEIYHVYPMKGTYAWKGCAHAYASAFGIKNLEDTKLYFIKQEDFFKAYKMLAKCLTNTKKYYCMHKSAEERFNMSMVNIEYMDATDMLGEIASWHKYLDFYLINIVDTRTYCKVLPEEFDECIRNLHRNGKRNLRVAKITDTLQKIMLAGYDASVNKYYTIYEFNESLFNLVKYVHINRVTDTEKHEPKNGYIIFVKQNASERFMLVYDTTSKFITNETGVIKMNQDYNSFITKICKKRELRIIKMVEFKNYCGLVNDKEFRKCQKQYTFSVTFITDYECTDILSKAEFKETTQVIDLTHFLQNA